MKNVIDELRSWGADTDGALHRMMNDTALYLRLLAQFTEDRMLLDVCQYYRQKKYADAFRAAHTMKGAAATLGLTPLFISLSDITEDLRGAAGQHPAAGTAGTAARAAAYTEMLPAACRHDFERYRRILKSFFALPGIRREP